MQIHLDIKISKRSRLLKVAFIAKQAVCNFKSVYSMRCPCQAVKR